MTYSFTVIFRRSIAGLVSAVICGLALGLPAHAGHQHSPRDDDCRPSDCYPGHGPGAKRKHKEEGPLLAGLRQSVSAAVTTPVGVVLHPELCLGDACTRVPGPAVDGRATALVITYVLEDEARLPDVATRAGAEIYRCDDPMNPRGWGLRIDATGSTLRAGSHVEITLNGEPLPPVPASALHRTDAPGIGPIILKLACTP